MEEVPNFLLFSNQNSDLDNEQLDEIEQKAQAKNTNRATEWWGGQGGGRPGEKGAGGVREAGEEGAGSGIPKVAGSGRKGEKLRNIAQYFAIEKMQRGGSQKIQGGNRD